MTFFPLAEVPMMPTAMANGRQQQGEARVEQLLFGEERPYTGQTPEKNIIQV